MNAQWRWRLVKLDDGGVETWGALWRLEKKFAKDA